MGQEQNYGQEHTHVHMHDGTEHTHDGTEHTHGESTEHAHDGTEHTHGEGMEHAHDGTEHTHGEGMKHTHDGAEHTHMHEGAEHMHVHTHDGAEHMHAHDGTEHTHGHKHSHENTKAVLNRLSRAIGHLQSIKHMVEDGRDCSEVLIQLSAVKAAINNTGKVILQDHIEHCLVDAIETGDKKTIEELNKAIDRFIK